MTSLQDGVLTPEQYVERHKRAFRAAFDYLNAHFPPVVNDEYWQKAAKDIGEVSSAARDPLAWELLLGVYKYLEQEYKLRRDLNEKTGDRDD